MDSNSVVFLWAMVAAAAVGILAFLILLVAARARRPVEAGSRARQAPPERWYVPVLAVLLVALVAGLLVWQFLLDGEAVPDGLADARSLIFILIMAVVGLLGLIGFPIYVFGRDAGRERAAAPAQAAVAGNAETGSETSSGTRLLGLLALALAVLLANWIYVPRAEQYGLMVHLIYPAGLGVALVLLFDKATRGWSAKGGADTAREWLFCDAIVFLLVLGFLNLMASEAGESYIALTVDLLYIVLFFFTFWFVDRALTRYRFLVAYGYFIALPIGLLIWRMVQDVAPPEEYMWWSTIWPFFILAIIFFVAEIISLVATANTDRPVVPAIKDAVFFIAYGVLLIIAIPGTEV